MVARKKDVSRGERAGPGASRDNKKGDNHPKEVRSNGLSLDSAIDAIAEGVIIRDKNGKIIDCNPSAERILGLSIDEMKGRDVFDPSWEEIHEDGSPFPLERRPVNVVLRTGQPQSNVVVGLRKSNGVLWLLLGTYPLFQGSESKPSGLVTSFIDITERKKAEARQAMEHTVTRLLSEADTLPEVMLKIIQTICETLGCACGAYWSWDDRDQLLHCTETWNIPSPEIEEFLVLTRQSTNAPDTGGGLIRRTWTNRKATWITDVMQDPSFRRAPLAAKAGLRAALGFPMLAQGEILGVIEIFSRDSRQPDEVLIQSVNAIGSQIGQFLRRKRAEEASRQANESLRALVQNSPLAIFIYDFDGIVSLWNPAAERIYGWTEAEVVGHFLPSVQGDKAKEEFRLLREQVMRGESVTNVELVRKRRDGRSIDITVSIASLYDAGGKPIGIMALSTDITTRKQAEAQQAMEHAITRLLAESKDPAEAMPRIIQAICEISGCDHGAYWGLDKQSQLLRRADTWSSPSLDAAEFTESSHQEATAIQSTQSPKLGGVIRRALITGEPIWVPDVTKDPTFRRAAIAAKIGLHTAFAFPVLVNGIVLGVMEFFSRDIRQRDELLLQSVRSIGSQIGLFYQRKQMEARQAMEHAVTRLLAEAGAGAEAIPKILQTICETLGWDYGGYWSLDEEAQLFRCTETWTAPAVEATEFMTLTRQITNVPGTSGMIRRILANMEPIWIADVTEDKSFRRGAVAAKAGLHSAFAFPILIGREIIGVMEFFSHSIRQPDEILMEIARSIGIQIGQFCQRKQAEERIQYLAYYDGLTGLPNRILFSQRLGHALTQVRRYKKPLAVLFIDLDRFKNINDTLGHEAGDRLLQEMATRLKDCLRESDTVARLGGDEFVILLEDIVDPKHAANVARKIIGAALNPFTLSGAEYHITASVGISVYPEDGEDEQTLMKHADIAMYLAKDHGKNNYQFYSTQINAHSFERLALESSLRRALERKEFLLHYQAKVDLATGKVTGMEALIRWQHVDLGMVSPALFIPLAEETGLIVPIGRWVLKTACAQNRAWQEQGLPRLRISVNLSARQFNDDHLMEDVAQALKETGLDPELLELELTESMVMYNPDKAVKLLTAFKAMGVYLAIDDFGIGYSSLAHLKRFPIDTIKVDRSFIKDIMENREDAAITEAIIAMGKSLNLNVIAEGVETNDQVNFLRDHECDEMQGFYFSKPLSDREFADLLRKGTGLVQKDIS